MNKHGDARFVWLDATRGFAIVLMVVYHFSYDLDLFGYLDIDFNHDPRWRFFRAVIVSMFLVVVGISLTLATRRGIQWRTFSQRLGLVAACALLVSVGSGWMFPNSLIFFGILHFIAVASLLGLIFIRLFGIRFFWLNLWLGLLLVAMGVFVQLPFFDHPWLQWVGMMTYKPVTEDYVPLLPWFGVVLIGMFAGQYFVAHQNQFPSMDQGMGKVRRVAGVDGLPMTLLLSSLAAAGRHSLLIYMVHQPILIGILYLVL